MTEEELKKEAVESAEKFFGKPTDLVDLDNLRIFKNGYLASAEPREKRIAELEKENAELKEQNRSYEQLIDTGSVTLMQERLKNYKQLTTAKEIIRECIKHICDTFCEVSTCEHCLFKSKVKDKAEQFLKDCDTDNAIQQANKGLDFDKIADEMEQDLKDNEVE